MNKANRVKNALAHGQTDKVPYNIELTKEMEKNIERELSLEAGSFFDWAGNHIEKCGFETEEEITPGFFKDEYGVVWDRTGMDKDIGTITKMTFDEPEICGYTFPGVEKEVIKEKCMRFVTKGKDTFKFAKLGMTLFERAWSLRGFENMLMDLMLEEEFVHELFTRITQRNMQILDIALEYDFDGVYFGDDYGQQTGLLISPDTWRKCVKPYLRILFEKAKTKGKIVCLHSCGNISGILSDLIDIGLDVYQTVQPEVYDLKKLKKEFGANLCFYGGISTQRDLPFKTPNEIYSIVKETMRILGEGGGYIAAPTHRVTPDTPAANILAMAEVLRKQESLP